MSSLGKSAAVKGLVRKLLLKVHPDVVASISDSARTHNERSLKLLLSHLNEPSKDFTQTVSFYLKEGGQTRSVALDPRNPEKTVRMLLGLPLEAGGDSLSAGSASKEAWGQGRQRRTEKREDLSKGEREELARAFKESLEHWWTIKDMMLTDLDRLFEQNRIRYVTDAFETSARVDVDMNELELKRAVDLARQTFEFHVDDTTLRALQLPQLAHLDFIIVGRNLLNPEYKQKTLFVPLRSPPEVFGSAVDGLVANVVFRASDATSHKI